MGGGFVATQTGRGLFAHPMFVASVIWLCAATLSVRASQCVQLAIPQLQDPSYRS